jgi:Cof subfamily protein (haloacid dehalogenase superfamily)
VVGLVLGSCMKAESGKKRMIRMIATDLDGTLLRSDKSISDFTVDTLRKCREKGIKVIYATGRGGSAKRRAPSHMFDGRVIMNGAVAHSGSDLIYKRLIPMDLARDLLLACDEHGLKTTAEISGMHYSNFYVNRQWSNIHDYQIADFSTLDIEAEKLYALVEKSADVDFIIKHIPQGLYLTVSRDGLAQIMHVEARKARAIEALAKHWGIELADVLSFGDDLNDIDMLRECGIGIAMGDAVEEAKDAANLVCESNDDDGIARWIAANVL